MGILRKNRLEDLHELIRRNNLYMVYYFCFIDEADARKVYNSLRSGNYWIPIKCAIALRKANVFYPYWVVLYNNEPEYLEELPKPKIVSWYWSDYLTKMGLPKQQEFDQARTDQKLWYNERIAALLDYFVSPSLEKGIYECLVCHETFGSHNDLMNHLRGSGHDDQFNAIMIDQFNVVARTKAAEVIEKIGEAVEPLIEALKNENVYIRRRAAEVLIRMGEPAVKPLVQALEDKDSDRMRVAIALDELGWKPRDDTEKASYLIAKKEWDELAKLREPAVGLLIEALKDKDEDVRKHAATALGEIGDERALQQLIQALNNEWGVQSEVAKALGKIGEPAVEPLIQALEDRDENLRSGAAMALGNIGDARASAPLIEALKDENRDVRREAAFALGEVGDERAVEPLIQALKYEDKWIRKAAAMSLGQVGDARAVEPLIQALKYGDTDVRSGAEIGLGKLGELAVEPLVHVMNDKHQDMDARWKAAMALGEIGDERALEPLTRVMMDDHENIYFREGALECLGRLGKPAVEILIQTLKAEDAPFQIKAAHALGDIGDARAVEPLTKALESEKRFVREAAKEALEKIKAKKG